MCSLDAAFVSASVRNRPQRTATVPNRSEVSANDRREGNMAVPIASSAKAVILRISNVAYLCLAWQGWHFVTDVSYGVQRRFA